MDDGRPIGHWLSHFVDGSAVRVGGRVHFKAFLGDFSTDKGVSTYEHAMFEVDIDWMTGRAVKANHLRGSVEISSNEVVFLGGTLCRTESPFSPEHHVDIYDLTTIRKATELATALADSSVYVRSPETSVSLAKANPFLSFYLVVEGSAQSYRKCLESLSRQTAEGWECVILINGRTDELTSLAEEFVDTDPKKPMLFRSFDQDRRPLVEARKRACDVVRGPWICELKAECELSQGVIEACLQKISAAGDVTEITTDIGLLRKDFR